MDKKISKELEEASEKRTLYQYRGGERICVTGDDGRHYISTAMPILTEGDLMGGVLLLLEEQDAPLEEAQQQLVQTVAGFLGRQMES
jgi:AbrB family transcriptional regulator (stage V sporulation protein T)